MSRGQKVRKVVADADGVFFLVTLHSELLKHPVRVTSSWVATKSRGEVYEAYPFGVKCENEDVFIIWEMPDERLNGVLDNLRAELEVVSIKNANKVLLYFENVNLLERKGVKGGKK